MTARMCPVSGEVNLHMTYMEWMDLRIALNSRFGDANTRKVTLAELYECLRTFSVATEGLD